MSIYTIDKLKFIHCYLKACRALEIFFAIASLNTEEKHLFYFTKSLSQLKYSGGNGLGNRGEVDANVRVERREGTDLDMAKRSRLSNDFECFKR